MIISHQISIVKMSESMIFFCTFNSSWWMLQRIKIKSATINIIVNKINEKEAFDLIQDNWSCQEYPLGIFLIKLQQLRLNLKKINWVKHFYELNLKSIPMLLPQENPIDGKKCWTNTICKYLNNRCCVKKKWRLKAYNGIHLKLCYQGFFWIKKFRILF